MDLDDPAIRKAATGKLEYAFKLWDGLWAEMEEWWSATPITLALELREDNRTIDFVMLTAPLPDLEGWYNRAGDVLQNLRNALNRLTKAVCFNFSAPAKPGDGNFPIHDAAIGWEQWLKKHAELPIDIAERFRAFEPFVSGRPFLLALRDSNNLEKHDVGFQVGVTLTELKADLGTMTVEGQWDRDNLGERLRLLAGETIDVVAGRQVIGTVEMPTRVITLDPSAAKVSPTFTFTPVIRYEEQEIPLGDAVDLIKREVAWAISYVTGLVSDPVTSPTHFDL